MHVPAPHFLLYSEAASAADAQQALPGRWRFVLRSPDGETALQAADDEDGATPERLELLAIVRGLESLDQPSRVTLVTGSRNVRRGLKYGLSHWRETGWQWERYGRMSPVKNADLWQRVDRALEIHSIDFREGRLERSSDLAQQAPPPRKLQSQRPVICSHRNRGGRTLRVDPGPVRESKRQQPRRSQGPTNRTDWLPYRLIGFAGSCILRYCTLKKLPH